MDFDDLVKKKKINLTCKDLRDGNIDVLAEVVRKSNILEVLDLYGNRLTLADGKMADAIARSPTLRLLGLGDNTISDEGAKRLADAIKANKTLQVIGLHHNGIGDEGAKSLAEALAENKSLRVMDLGRNKIGDEGARSLAASLETNQTLQRIYLAGTNITDEGALRLAEALKVNYIISLDFGGYSISDQVWEKIEAILGNKTRMHVQKIIESKDKENIDLCEVLAAKDEELKNKEEEIASLKAASLEAIDLLKKSIKTPWNNRR